MSAETDRYISNAIGDRYQCQQCLEIMGCEEISSFTDHPAPGVNLEVLCCPKIACRRCEVSEIEAENITDELNRIQGMESLDSVAKANLETIIIILEGVFDL